MILVTLSLNIFGFCNNGTLITGKTLGHFHLLASGEWMPLWVQQLAYY
jgi:hypothetical protein